MKKPPIRAYIAIMVFFSTFTCYMLRLNVNVSIIDMVDRESTNFTPICERGKNITKPKKNKTGDTVNFEKYAWNEKEVGLVLASYTVGTLVTCVPAGLLAERFGAWHIILWCSVGQGVLNLLTPISAKIGVWGVIVNRFLIGLGGGAIYPAVNTLISKWAPPNERGRFLAAMMGNTIGTVFTYSTVGAITHKWGWPWGFYFLSMFQGLYCLVFAFVTASTPDQHYWISEKEKNYIAEAQGGTLSKKKKIAPLVEIITSVPFWITTTAQFGNLWNLNLIASYTPKLMAETMGFKIREAGFLSAVPYLARMLMSIIFGNIADFIKTKNLMTLTHNRKFFIIFSHLIPAVCLLSIQFPKCDYVPVVVLLVLNQGFNSAVVGSHLVNPQDIAPNFAGTIFGIMNFVGMSTGFLTPVITGVINHHYEMELGAVVVIASIGASIICAAGIFFILFGSAEVQPWNEIPEDTEQPTNAR